MNILIIYRKTLFSIFATLLSLSSLAEPGLILGSSMPDYATGKYQESSVDMSVKVTGGYIQVVRSYSGSSWQFNRGAEGARLSYAREDDSVPEKIEISGITYQIDPSTVNPDATGDDPQAVYYRERGNELSEVESHIDKKVSGYRWQDDSGNWLTYDTEGQLIEGGDRNTVINRTTRDAQNRIFQVLDAHDQLVMTYEYAAFDSDKITKIEDYTGRSVQYHWDGDKLIGVTDVRGQYWSYEYGANGEIIARIDPLNRKIRISYVGGIVTQMTQPGGFSTAYAYDYDEVRKRYYLRQQDDAGKVTERWYDQNGVLLEVRVDGLLVQKTTETAQGYNKIRQIQYVGGRTLTQTYNQYNKLIKVVRNDGSYETAEYDGPYHKISRHRAANGKITGFDYDDNGNLIRMTEAVGTPLQRMVEFTYDQYGQRVVIHYPQDALTAAADYSIEYDNHGNAVKRLASLNSSVQLQYNVTGHVIRTEDAAGAVTELAYDAANSLLSITDPLSRVYTATYDAAGQRTSVTAPNGRIVRYSYDSNGRRSQVAAYAQDNSQLTSVSYDYDEMARKISVTDALGYSESRTFDALGQIQQYTNRAGEVTEYQYNQGILQTLKLPDYSRSYQYDLAGNPAKETLSWDDSTDGSNAQQITRSRDYNEQGKPVSVTDANGNSKKSEYDILGRVVRVTDALGGVTQLAYDSRSNLLTFTDAENRVTRFTYDALNRKTSEQRSPVAGVTNIRRYFYDAVGRLTQEVTPQGNVKAHSYDAAGQRIQSRYYAAADVSAINVSAAGQYTEESLLSVEPEREVVFTYNLSGQLAELNEPGFRQQYHYTLLGQIAQTDTWLGSIHKIQKYEYDQRGKKIAYTNPEGIRYQYRYTPNGEIAQVVIPDEGSVVFRGYHSGKPAEILLPGGNRQRMTYDGLGRLTSKELIDPADNNLAQMALSFDAESNILGINREYGHIGYQYDALYRLTNVQNPVLADEQYTYDLVHNRTQRTLTQLDGSASSDSWHYNDDNQLTGYGNVSFGYNADGHTVRQSTCRRIDDGAGGSVESCQHRYYRYDARERLIAVDDQTDSGAVTRIAGYQYNELGQRFSKTTAQGTVYFLYDQTGLLGEYDEGGNLVREYQYTPGATFMTAPLFQHTVGAIGGMEYFYYFNDHLGTSQKLINKTGAIVWSGNMMAFGESFIGNEKLINNLRFPGQYYDAEVSTYYNYFRNYSPEVGRYLHSDPIGMHGGSNFYSYVYANPIKYMDVYGLSAESEATMTPMADELLASIALGATPSMLAWDQDTGHWDYYSYASDGTFDLHLEGDSYSGGAKGDVPEAINNPIYEYMPDVGPVPSGYYYAYRMANGNFHLIPASTNAMGWGEGMPNIPGMPEGGPIRFSFLIHGDSIENPGAQVASNGCLIINSGKRDQFDDVILVSVY